MSEHENGKKKTPIQDAMKACPRPIEQMPAAVTASTREVERTVWAARQYKDGKVVEIDDLKFEKVAMPYPAGMALAEASVSLGITKNLGNYESARIDVGVRLPCMTDEIDAAMETARTIARAKLAEETAKLLQHQRDKRNGPND